MTDFLMASKAGGISFTLIFAILTVAVFAVAVWLMCIGLKGNELKFKLKPMHLFIIVLAVGVLLRIVVAFSMKGLVGYAAAFTTPRAGYNGMVNMTQYLVHSGFAGFMKNYENVFYYPLTMYILTFFGSALSLFTEMSVNSIATLIFIKLPFILSDALLAFVVFKIAAKYAGEVVALAVGGLVALCPVFMLGAIWPSSYSFLALALVILVYFMLERRYLLLTVTYTISLLLGFEAIFMLPIVATFLIYAYVKKIIAYRNSGEKNLWDSEYSLIVKLPVTVVACAVVSYLLALPFALDYVGANPFKILSVYWLKPFNNFGYFTYNGLSLYTIFGKNGDFLKLSFPTYVFSIMFVAALVAITIIVYLSKKNRANLVMFSSFALFTVNTYFVNSSELTLLPCLALLLVAIVVLKDKRLMHVFGMSALFVFLNACGVLLKADYFSFNVHYVSEILNGGWAAFNIISSVFALIIHIYFTMVLLDIVMNGRIKKFDAADEKFSSALKDLIKIKD